MILKNIPLFLYNGTTVISYGEQQEAYFDKSTFNLYTESKRIYDLFKINKIVMMLTPSGVVTLSIDFANASYQANTSKDLLWYHIAGYVVSRDYK